MTSLEALVGRRTGIVRALSVAGTIDGDADLVHVGVEIANPHPALDGEHLRAGGAGRTREDAVGAALGEAVERYAAGSYSLAEATFAPYRALAEDALEPWSFARFSERQRARLPFTRPDADTPLHWRHGIDLATSAACLVPAFAVHLPYLPTHDEPPIDANLTTGLACGKSLDDAIERGAREVIERDALALLWILGLGPKRVAPEDVRAIAGDLLPPRDRVSVFDIRTDVGVPVFCVLAEGMGPRGPLVSFGAACDPEPRTALRKAALEVSQDRVYVRLLVERDPNWTPHPDFSNVTDFSLHARLYSGRPALAAKGLAFLQDRPTLPFDDTPGPTPRRALAACGLRAAAVDLTQPWAAALGLHVARVVVPELLPLHGNHLLRYEAHPRLADVDAMPGAARTHAAWPYPHAMP